MMNFWLFSAGCMMKFMFKLRVSGAPESWLYSWSKRHAPFNTQCLLICRDDSSLQVGLFWSVIWSVQAGSPWGVLCCRYRLHLPKLSLAVGNLQQEPAFSKKCFCSFLWDPWGVRMGHRGLYRMYIQPLPASRYSHSVNQPVIQPDPLGLSLK